MTAGAYEIETESGLFVNLDEPDPATITLEDIAWALSHEARYGGHAHRTYTVAEHALLVSDRLRQQGYPPWSQLRGLHHDDAEAYLKDIPAPLKRLLRRETDVYDRLTDRMDCAIMKALDLPVNHESIRDRVKLADQWAILLEARFLLPSGGKDWDDALHNRENVGRVVTPPFWNAHTGSPGAAFIARHHQLMEKIR